MDLDFFYGDLHFISDFLAVGLVGRAVYHPVGSLSYINKMPIVSIFSKLQIDLQFPSTSDSGISILICLLIYTEIT